MKKTVTIVLAIVLALTLIGCTPSTGDTGPKQLVVGYAQLGHESDWRVGCSESVKAAVAAAGWKLEFVDADQKQDEQIKALRDFITMNVDYIAFSPVVESGWDEVMQEIKEAGIPVVMLDRNIDMANREDYFEAWIGADFIEEGKKAANWLIDYMEAEGRGNDEINIVELQGTVGSSPANDRMKGFADTLASKSNYKIIMTQTGNFETDLGKTVMESFLKSGERIDVLFAHNDNMALGAIQAIEEAGLVPGVDIIIIGVDAIKLAFEEIIAGRMNVTVECTPLLGPKLVETIQKLIAGQPVPKTLNPDEYVYDMYFYNNAEEELPNRVY